MGYLEDILASNKATGQRRQTSRGNVQGMLSTLQAKKALAAIAPGSPVGGSAGPHAMGDGHGHQTPTGVKAANDEFKANLNRMIADSGGKISVGSGYRSNAEQQVLYDRWMRKVPGQAQAAKPGSSNHNFDLAADLVYKDGGREFAHANASKYGMVFPMSFEPWHIEPLNAKSLRGNVNLPR